VKDEEERKAHVLENAHEVLEYAEIKDSIKAWHRLALSQAVTLKS
jgi:hypothetical protein